MSGKRDRLSKPWRGRHCEFPIVLSLLVIRRINSPKPRTVSSKDLSWRCFHKKEGSYLLLVSLGSRQGWRQCLPRWGPSLSRHLGEGIPEPLRGLQCETNRRQLQGHWRYHKGWAVIYVLNEGTTEDRCPTSVTAVFDFSRRDKGWPIPPDRLWSALVGVAEEKHTCGTEYDSFHHVNWSMKDAANMKREMSILILYHLQLNAVTSDSSHITWSGSHVSGPTASFQLTPACVAVQWLLCKCMSCGSGVWMLTPYSEGFAVTTHLPPLGPSLYPNPHLRSDARPLRTLPSVRTVAPLLLCLASDRPCAGPNSKHEPFSCLHTHAYHWPSRMQSVQHHANAHSIPVMSREDTSINGVNYRANPMLPQGLERPSPPRLLRSCLRFPWASQKWSQPCWRFAPSECESLLHRRLDEDEVKTRSTYAVTQVYWSGAHSHWYLSRANMHVNGHLAMPDRKQLLQTHGSTCEELARLRRVETESAHLLFIRSMRSLRFTSSLLWWYPWSDSHWQMSESVHAPHILSNAEA